MATVDTQSQPTNSSQLSPMDYSKTYSSLKKNHEFQHSLYKDKISFLICYSWGKLKEYV